MTTASQTSLVLFIIGIAFSIIGYVGLTISKVPVPVKVEPAPPVEATIVGVYQTQSGDWWTTLSWGNGDRGSWNNKLGKEGDLVKIYPMRNGKFSIHREDAK